MTGRSRPAHGRDNVFYGFAIPAAASVHATWVGRSFRWRSARQSLDLFTVDLGAARPLPAELIRYVGSLMVRNAIQ